MSSEKRLYVRPTLCALGLRRSGSTTPPRSSLFSVRFHPSFTERRSSSPGQRTTLLHWVVRVLDDLAREIGTRLISEGYNLVSGFGLGLGEQCVIGALRALYGISKGVDLERLIVRPFPRATKTNQQQQNTRHREDLIARSGVIVVMAGNREQAGGNEISPGVLEEVDIALREGKRVIPLGATGYAARKVWEKAVADPERYLPGLKAGKELMTLGDSKATNDQLINALFGLLEKAEKAARL